MAASKSTVENWGWSRLLIGALLCSTGCSITPETGVTFFPQKHRISKPADELRQQHVHPLSIPRELAKTPMPEYRVEPGDVLQVEPSKADAVLEFTSNQTIPPDGTVDLARFGRIVVAGMTVEEIEDAVLNAMKAKDPKSAPVEVRLAQWTSKVFYVDGEVRSPGSYPLDGNETVLDAVYAAGGLTNKASRLNIILSRPTGPCGCRVVLPVCWDDIFQVGDATTNYQMQPGDRIYVATRTMKDKKQDKKRCLPCNKHQNGCKFDTINCCGLEAVEHTAAKPTAEKPTSQSAFSRLARVGGAQPTR